jgi:CheY-like chemotaxis protein
VILVVDDEQPLRDLLSGYLARLGYEVEACATAGEALTRFRERPSGYALVLSDAIMPEMSGQELLARVTGLNPEVRAVLTSGLPVSLPPLPPGAAGRVRFLQKPYTPAQLAQLIKELLEN